MAEGLVDDERHDRNDRPEEARRDRSAFALLLSLFLLYLACGASGYGTDNDTYGMLATWSELRHTGRYSPSRPPGYPLPEVVIGAASELAGHVGSNALSALLACIALNGLYALLASIFGKRSALASVAAVGLNPHWIIAASSSMDYVYGAAFFLLGVWSTTRARPTFAGLAFAASAASRLTYVPLILLTYSAWGWPLHATGRPVSHVVKSSALFACLTCAAYIPAFTALGTGTLDVYMSNRRVAFFGTEGFTSFFAYGSRFLYRNVALWGLPACVTLVMVGVFAVLRRRGSAIGQTRPIYETVTAVAALLIAELLLFLRLPFETAYLLPVLFLAVYWVNRGPHPGAFLGVLLGCHLLHAIVQFELVEVIYLQRSFESVEASGARFRPHLRRGVLWEDIALRKEAQAYYSNTILETVPTEHSPRVR